MAIDEEKIRKELLLDMGERIKRLLEDPYYNEYGSSLLGPSDILAHLRLLKFSIGESKVYDSGYFCCDVVSPNGINFSVTAMMHYSGAMLPCSDTDPDYEGEDEEYYDDDYEEEEEVEEKPIV